MKLIFREVRNISLYFLILSVFTTNASLGEDLVESFDVRGREIIVKLWQDENHNKQIKALPLSIKRNLHSFWGDICLASDSCIYLPPATHSDLEGAVWLVRYNPKTYMMDMVFDARKKLGKQIGFDGLWDSKIHTGCLEGKDGKIYFAGMIGGSYATMYTHLIHPSGYMGGHIYQYDIKTGETIALGIPYRHVSIIAADLDVERNILYMLDWPNSEFLIFPIDTRVVRNLGTTAYHPEGPNRERLQWGRDLFVYRDHTVWTFNNFGCFVKYDPEIDDLVDTKIALPKNEPLRVHVMGRGPTDGKVYCITSGGWVFEFDPRTGEVVEFGPVHDDGVAYSPNITITPDGRSLYYIAGTHGSEIGHGMHIMRYDILERKRIDCGWIGREKIPSHYCYGAAVYKELVYFIIHGGIPSNTYLYVYDPNDNRIFSK